MKIIVAILTISFVTGSLFGQSLDELKQKREETEKKIALTNKLLQKTQKDARVSLNKITLIGKQISSRKALISGINQEIGLIDTDIQGKRNSINATKAEIAKIKKEYEKAIYHTWKTRHSTNRLMYVLSGRDINEVYRRLRYLYEFTHFRKQQSELLVVMTADLQKELVAIEEKRDAKISLLDNKTQEQYRLQQEQVQQDQTVKSLKRQERKLKQQLKQQQKEMDKLNKFIEDVIAEEIRKANEGKSNTSAGKFSLTPQEQLVSDQFDKNKGKLPWPVDQGVIVSKYGKHKHEVEKTVVLDNPGIDIQTEEGEKARAIFNGTVTGVYPLPGYNLGVIVRHGEYLTFYANLSEVFVKKGDNIVTKQELGRIYTDEFRDITFLHFEVWKSQVKNNPEYWIAR